MAIPRRQRRRLKRQAQGENRVDVAPARQQIRQANRDYNRDVSDARGAQKVMLSQLSSMLGNISGSGMGGRYAQQTRADLRSRKAEAMSGLPYAISQAQGRRADVVADARAAIASARSDAAAASSKRFSDLLDDARESAPDPKAVRNAMVTAGGIWNAASADQRQGLLENPGMFASDVAKATKGTEAADARAAIQRMFGGVNKKKLQARAAEERSRKLRSKLGGW